MRAMLFVMLAGCVRPAAFACDDDGQCTRGSERGTCEINGRCSFADADCESGRRFGELSGEQGGECVGETSDAGVDAIVLPNEPIDDASAVCSGFTLAGGRYYKRLAAAGWTNQRTACGMIVGNVYLAVPDDADELAAIVEVAGGDVWLGISDASDEGAYVTVHGNAATFLPWAANEPDNSGNQDCVRSIGTAIETAVCGAPTLAVCECTP